MYRSLPPHDYYAYCGLALSLYAVGNIEDANAAFHQVISMEQHSCVSERYDLFLVFSGVDARHEWKIHALITNPISIRNEKAAVYFKPYNSYYRLLALLPRRFVVVCAQEFLLLLSR